MTQGDQSVKDYVAQFDDLYRFVRNLFPINELKIERFKQGLSLGIQSRISLFSFTTYRSWVDTALHAEQLM